MLGFQLVIALGNYLVFAWDGSTSTWSLIVAALLQNCYSLYSSYLVANSLFLRKQTFQPMHIDDVLRCFHWAISTLNEGRQPMQSINAKEMLKVLKAMYNIKPWRELKKQQMRELNVIYKVLTSEVKLDLSEETDPKLLEAASCLKLFSGEEADYYRKLKNMKRLEDTIIDREYRIKALETSFLTQANFNYLASKNKQLVKRSAKSVISVDTYRQRTAAGKCKVAESAAESLLRDPCSWVRGKDVFPGDKEVELFSEEYRGSVRYVRM